MPRFTKLPYVPIKKTMLRYRGVLGQNKLKNFIYPLYIKQVMRKTTKDLYKSHVRISNDQILHYARKINDANLFSNIWHLESEVCKMAHNSTSADLVEFLASLHPADLSVEMIAVLTNKILTEKSSSNVKMDLLVQIFSSKLEYITAAGHNSSAMDISTILSYAMDLILKIQPKNSLFFISSILTLSEKMALLLQVMNVKN